MSYRKRAYRSSVAKRAQFPTGRKKPIAAAIACLVAVSQAHAASGALEEITVTATRRAANVQDIPYNISAISGDQLRNAGITDLTDLTRALPGVAYADLGIRSAGINSQLIMRGLNSNPEGSIGAYIPNSTPAAVSTYLDETPLFVNLKLADLKRVEVLRGPQGTLYGSGSLGGTLRFIYNQPDPKKFSTRLTGRLSQSEDAGNLNDSVDAVFNVPLWANAAVRVSAGYEKLAGVTDASNLVTLGPNGPLLADPSNPFGSGVVTHSQKDTDRAKQWYARASLLWNITDRLRAVVTYHHQTDNTGGFTWETFPGVPGARKRTHTQYFNSPMHRDVDLYSGDITLDLGFATLTSATSYSEDKSHSLCDITGLLRTVDVAAGGFAYGGFPLGLNGRLLGFCNIRNKDDSFVEEARLVSNGKGRINWVGGAYYQNFKRDYFEVVTSPGFAQWANLPAHPIASLIAGFPISWAQFLETPVAYGGAGVLPQNIASEKAIVLSQKFKVEDIALYGQMSYQITDAWQATAGARVFWNKFSGDLAEQHPLCGAFCSDDLMNPEGLNAAHGSDSVQDQIFEFNTSYRFTGALMTYFTWSQGFRRGGVNTIPLSGFAAESPAILTFKPDKVTNYEIGAKGGLFNRFDYTMALYRIDWDKPQISGTSVPGGMPITVNGSKAQTQGVELEVRGRLSDSLDFNFGYTYTDAKLTQSFAIPNIPPTAPPDISGGKGDKLPGVPEHMVSWALDYHHPVNLFGESEVRLHVDGSYRSSVTTALTPTTPSFAKLDGFDIWNASLTWSKDQWQVGAFVKNLTDEPGITAVLLDFAAAEPKFSSAFMTRPRTVGVMLGYSFN